MTFGLENRSRLSFGARESASRLTSSGSQNITSDVYGASSRA